MHVVLENQSDGKKIVLCVDRASRSCRVIDPPNLEVLPTLEDIARALGASNLVIVINKDAEKFKSAGYKPVEVSVMTKVL